MSEPATPRRAASEEPAIDTNALLKKPIWTLDDLAAFLVLPKATLYKQRSMGLLAPGYRLGKHLRFRREDVLAWMETNRDPD